jgi:hypothetical protein
LPHHPPPPPPPPPPPASLPLCPQDGSIMQDLEVRRETDRRL